MEKNLLTGIYESSPWDHQQQIHTHKILNISVKMKFMEQTIYTYFWGLSTISD